MYICFKIVRNGIAFPKQISRIDKNSRKAHKKIRFPAAGDCSDIRKEMKHLK